MSKSKVDKLLQKGLTGWEVGILAIKDAIGIREARKPTFSKADFSHMKRSLRTEKDIDDYNKLIDVWTVVDEALHVANICELSALVDLGSLDELASYGLARASFELHLLMIPKIVTQKQLEEYIQEEREKVLGWTWEREDLVKARAITLASEELPRNHLDFVAWEDIPEDELPLYEKQIPKAEKEISKLLHGLPSVGENGEEEYLARDLYEAGMEEIREMADRISTITPGSERFPPFRHLAVIQDPPEGAVDENGHYIDRHGPPFTRLGPTLANALSESGEGEELISVVSKRSRDSIRTFYAIKTVMEQLTEVLDVDLLESINQWEGRLQAGVDGYNGKTTLLRDFLPDSEDKNPFYSGKDLPEYLQALPLFDLERLTPSDASIKKARERITKILGEGWWMQDLMELFEYPDGWTKKQAEEELGLTSEDLR